MNEEQSNYDQVIILIFFVCLLRKQHATLKCKGVISMFPVLQGSADNQVRWEIIASFNCPLPAKHSCQKLLKFSDAYLT